MTGLLRAVCAFAILISPTVTLLSSGNAQAAFTTVLNIPPDPDIPNNTIIGSDTQVNLSTGGAIGAGVFAGTSGGGSTNIEVNISGGTVGNGFRAFSDSVVNISSGALDDVNFHDNTTGHISGGVFGDEVNFFSNSVGEITGGVFSGNGAYDVFSNGRLVVRGGQFDDQTGHFGDSVTDIHGGVYSGEFDAFGNATINLFATSFSVGGVPIVLNPGQMLTIADRDVDFDAVLADGNAFSIFLGTADVLGVDEFASTATLKVTAVVPLPAAVWLFGSGLLALLGMSLRWKPV